MIQDLPYEAEYKAAKKKLYQETILFVPFYGGNKAALKKHVAFANEQGFDCVIFNLKKESIHPDGLPISSQMEFGMKHVWADQVEQLCNSIPGQKIIFSFSNPSASAIEAVARRRANDVSAMVCEGGPSGDIWKSIYNYYSHEKPLSNFLLKGLAATLSSVAWSPLFHKELNEDLSQLPKNFPVLSIRGWKDKLISPHMIDKVFEKASQIQLQKLNLPRAAHLNGLRDYPEEYIKPTSEFLKRNSIKN